MIRLLLILVSLASLLEPAFAGYTVHVDSQRQAFVTVNGPYGPESHPASAETPPPPTYGAEVCRPENYSPFAAETARRTRVFADNYGVATLQDILSACPGYRDQVKGRIRAEGARRLEALTPYSAAERDTWPQQQAEAKEFRANSACSCVMIRKIAEERVISLESLVQKIEENVALFPTAAGTILGQQQRLLDRIETATDFEQMMSITWQ